MRLFLACLIAALWIGSLAAAEWKPAEGPLATQWSADVTPDKVLREYPRPQMTREAWMSLNGLWSYAIRPQADKQPEKYDGEILVPFAVESSLSGVMKQVPAKHRLWYRRAFEVPGQWNVGRVLLHFGAVDWETAVWINGKEVGRHQGGYDPFVFDVTDALRKQGAQQIVVDVLDPTDDSFQPRGKQVRNPGGIMYTPITGIWQTVWLENVPATYIRSLHIVPNVDAGTIEISADVAGDDAKTAKLEIAADQDKFCPIEADGAKLTAQLKDVKLWSPDSPHLYDVSLALNVGGKQVDRVGSYFGMRKIALGKDEQGVMRLLLNGKFVFQYGPLDQGYWPDGLYTAPTEAAMRYDLDMLKAIGCNMLRKHVKLEPARYYYLCDKLGLLVWQDMPSGDRGISPSDPDIKRSEESAANYRREWKAIIDACRNAPSIVMWVPFNEGWGQFDTADIVSWTERYDPTRLVNNASGWTDRGVGAVNDMHNYPGPGMPSLETNRAVVLGEFGGLGLPVEGHTWLAKGNWGYKTYESGEQLTEAYLQLMQRLRILVGQGLSAAVYTQTTDVEVEVNGWLTYDRKIFKLDKQAVAAAHRKLYLPPPVEHVVLATSEQKPAKWRYTFDKPNDHWPQANFSDVDWKEGEAGFGTEGTPNSKIQTKWDGKDIWIRRTFEVERAPQGELMLKINHDEDAQVYLNGALVAEIGGYANEYQTLALRKGATLKTGANTLAVHCRQTTGGQFIDVGLVEVIEADGTGAAKKSDPAKAEQ